MATLPYGLGIHQWNVPAARVTRFLYVSASEIPVDKPLVLDH